MYAVFYMQVKTMVMVLSSRARHENKPAGNMNGY